MICFVIIDPPKLSSMLLRRDGCTELGATSFGPSNAYSTICARTVRKISIKRAKSDRASGRGDVYSCVGYCRFIKGGSAQGLKVTQILESLLA